MIEIIKRCVCDRCGSCGPETLESEDSVMLAQAEGWRCDGEDLCPACIAKLDSTA